jgi:AraC family cel operon transcriptional repressor
MQTKVKKLRFAERAAQGPCFNLIEVEWGRNRLPGEHTHDYEEIFWLTQGTCLHRLNEREERLEVGEVVFLRAADRHQLMPIPGCGGFRFLNLSLAPAVSARLRRAYPEEWRRLYEREDNRPWIVRAGQGDRAELEGVLSALARAEHGFFSVERAVLQIWAWALGTKVRRGPAACRDMPDWLGAALARLEEPEVFSRGVAGFVAAAGRSAEHVARECRRVLAKTPTELVNAARLRYAAHVLRMTTRPVLEVALDCGFAGTTQFHRVFKAAYGTTPHRWRREG